jgi:L-threonylcarbamoyladenylate synthase
VQAEIESALKILESGGVILYPTETIWGIGCDATNVSAIQKIYAIKNRPSEKNLILLVDGDQMLMKYVSDVPALAWELMEMTEKPLTIIYEKPYHLPPELIADDNTIGIRITTDPFCKALIRKLKKPLVSTSANLSGEKSPGYFGEISEKIKKSVDHIVNLRQDEQKRNPASSIIRLKNNGEISIIRP